MHTHLVRIFGVIVEKLFVFLEPSVHSERSDRDKSLQFSVGVSFRSSLGCLAPDNDIEDLMFFVSRGIGRTCEVLLRHVGCVEEIERIPRLEPSAQS